MKQMILTISLLFGLQALALEFDVSQIDVEKVKKLLEKNLDDEIFLKERIKLEGHGNPGIPIRGEVRGHKVGNGFSMPSKDPKIQVVKTCLVPQSDIEFLLLQDKAYKLYAVLTSDKEERNLAEFLNVQYVERSAGMRSYHSIVGNNPLRGEMFQLEWLKQNSGILRIVFNEKLHHFYVNCHE